MQRACVIPSKKTDYFDPNEPVQNRLHKSIKLWSMFADLEESFGTFESAKRVYENIIELRIASPQIIINYGLFLEENKFFEEAFRVYEKGIALFKWPVVYDIWLKYLTNFIARYGGSKLERLRDLFEQCVENIPQKFAKAIYLLYAKLEENHGLAKRAIKIYERATEAVLPEERYEMYNIYIKQVASMKGVTATREIFEKAIEVLPDDQVREICTRYADMERKLGEIDRARAIYVHCSQICDPKTTPKFWQVWKEFEIAHGNEETVREMLRIKRSVQAAYNVQVNFMSAQMIASSASSSSSSGNNAAGSGSGAKENEDPMSSLEAKAAELARKTILEAANNKNRGVNFVKSNDVVNASEDKAESENKNPAEINIDDLDDDDEDESEKEDGGGEKEDHNGKDASEEENQE